MTRLDGKIAFITGAARGQGRTHAVRLAQEGADIVAVDLCRQQANLDYTSGTPEDLEETVRLVEKEGRRIIARAADVRDQASLDVVVEEALREFGGIDILVSNAGISNQGSVVGLTDQQWEDILGTNLVGAWHSCRAVLPSMIERGAGGSVIFVSSTVGLRGAPGQAHYSASKHGMQGLMLSLANEVGQHNIRVNSVNPGAVNTEMAINESLLKMFLPDIENPTPADAADLFSNLTLLPIPWVEPEDVSNAVLWLASDEARFVTGAAIPVDGGQLARA
ncbi:MULTISPECIES: mycofactocin-coupled SDR family oxidoreductase [Rhodococcus]|uniref:Mycofactocin-coupled SDR family oxidoreductase n=1 Tax=Rhodococcus opacus TaxID=37919 RepID=A0AAX3YTF9_RHOOP|nr:MULTISPECIES: mycofactocin-coupled SDR family oxidoreductase [Rhodococcus]NHU48218.1 mycofactocin-coupled SDR family oxidoreductase [Rhodococcus sp. A14]EJI98291.1 short chain dehydrogenase family protein [Rhodococcus sp. JVH1]MCZ4589257.1 mycofactocin-coupled SDR family oxidoreductase [Rhodococcus opacus]WLF51765.1 mycofactocin-coupled SDR family oxidoreductase [Rhodococcus opacus]WLF52438.1 mycofactocin-coupled SDR family oxidoreductase [Rhodococcus opacus]